jgi:signal transduction histidine kinase
VITKYILGAASRDWGAAPSTLGWLTGATFLIATLLWLVTGGGYFWPVWIAFAGFVPVSLMLLLPRAIEGRTGPRVKLALNAAICGWVAVVLFMIWAFTGGGPYWPAITTAVLALVVVVHAILIRNAPDEELQERVTELTRTRRGALDVQAEELRRIERDLHDGAQARLVALSMQLGRAEERLSDRPEDQELVRAAREEAGNAIAELRDLARGIAPPVLADRGLPAAVEALGARSAVAVEVNADVPAERRPVPAVESVAYFVAAEAITNVAKHASGPARVDIERAGNLLTVRVRDQGPGGADPAGSGLSGLRNRVESVDGELRVESSPGGGTTVTAELPCE